MRLPTTAVHAGHIPLKPGAPSAPPIVTATAWAHDDVEILDEALGDASAGYVYARNAAPTQEAFEAAVNALERGHGAAAYASGMAALHAALLVAGARPRAIILAANELYGVTQALLGHLAANNEVDVVRVDIQDLAAVAHKLESRRPHVFLFETLSNPLCRLADVPALIALAQRYACRVVIDATFTSPVLLQPLAFGADLVMHSATKYIGGHGDVLAGVVTARTAEDVEQLHAVRRMLGANLAPFDAYLALRGLRTLPLRVREQCHNALALAQWLQTHPRIERVYYPGLPTDPDHALATRLLPAGLFGAMLAFDLKNAGKAEALAIMARLRVVQRRATLGDVATLIAYPAHASHRALTAAQRHALGIGDHCLRLSVGIEAVEDVREDLECALRS